MSGVRISPLAGSIYSALDVGRWAFDVFLVRPEKLRNLIGKFFALGNSYWLTRFVILRLLGFVYAIAFLVAVNQLVPLIGEHGLTPATHFLNEVQTQLGSRSAGTGPRRGRARRRRRRLRSADVPAMAIQFGTEGRSADQGAHERRSEVPWLGFAARISRRSTSISIGVRS